jgi:aminomuconate-semialdehyde/2-hydroxymuconate-6-semialdehyde dehydrogenase
MTSLTAFMLCEVLKKAGLPAGVVNIVFGLGNHTGAALVSHPDVRAISFTGGTATGRKIQELAAAHNKKISLELGGKNANVIFADCDLETAVATSIRSSFANQGEICLCGSRILVEKSIYDNFLSGFIKATSELRVGDPFDPETFVGALNSKPHMEKVQYYIDLARSEGCDILTPAIISPNVQKGGYFIAPTIILNVQRNSRLMMEEIFGPVVCIVPFEDEDDAIALANSTEYGLSASVWTKDIKRAHLMARKLEVGTVWVNCWMLRDLSMPFGGVKASGIGREGGKFSLEFFSEVKTVTMAI